jgi:parallel beta-helix repeat protein
MNKTQSNSNNNKLLIFRTTIIFVILLFHIVSFSEDIYVGGIVAEDQFWTNNNTYIVTQDIIVTNNITLYIEAGVKVKIEFGRGIIIDQGNFIVNGSQTDTVVFYPNYTFPGHSWKWKGIEIKNQTDENTVLVKYASVGNAETAVLLQNSKNATIMNSTLYNCQNIGLQILGSSNNTIDNCRIIDNYDGIEISARVFDKSSNNIISNNIITNQNQNIYVFRESGGIVRNNLIEKNVLSSANNGIWIVNMGENVNSGNIISENIFIHNGSEVGFGIYLDYDSTIVKNNIFWDNNIALFTYKHAINCQIKHNSFYQNNRAIVIGEGSESSVYSNNTISEISGEYIGIRETTGNLIYYNNLLNYGDNENIVINYRDNDLPIANNYWHTKYAQEIRKLIYDKYKDPAVGELFFTPYLQNISTINPISPPYKVVKQLVGQNIRVSWHKNPETDLKSYKLYYGNFNDYSFSDGGSEEVMDTVFFLDDTFSIDDTIAITSLDTVQSIDPQLSGNESPFAFALAYPYAGNDTTICSDIEAFAIKSSTVPFGYQGLVWESSGDGVFSNQNIVSPVYFPGVGDYENGKVKLTIFVSANGVSYQDSFVLNILNYPVVYAGSDTVVLQDEEYQAVNSMAENYDSIKWFSSGDGVFDQESILNTVYTPGVLDNENGGVTLSLNAYSQCGIESDSMKLSIEPHFSLEGKLLDNSTFPYPGVVLALREENPNTKAYQIQIVETDGKFEFQRLRGGSYYLYAIPDTNNPENLIPLYYANKTNWQESYKINVDADVFDVDIQLKTVDFILPPGEGSISGHLNNPGQEFYNPEVFCIPWFDYDNGLFCTDGLSNITVFLYNHEGSKLLGFTLTDYNGDFSFKNLPFGKFIVKAEKASYYSSASPLIFLSPEHKNEDGLQLQITQNKIGFKKININNLTFSAQVFPNPANDFLNIFYDGLSNSYYKVQIYNSEGVIVKNNQQHFDYSSSTSINIRTLKPGLYIGKILSGNQIVTFRFLKN